MARFYFDFHDANGVLRDDDGEELPRCYHRAERRRSRPSAKQLRT